MRRAHVGRSDAMVKSEQGEQGFWPSYADMMSAVALILFFLMLLAYIQNMITGNTLRRTEETLGITQQELEDSDKNLSSARLQLSDTQSKLTLTQRQVDAATDELSKITTDLDAARTTLEQQQKDLETQKSELASQSQLLSDQEKLISQQEAYLLAANEEILSMHNQMQSISVLRMDILKQIRDSVVQVMGDSSRVSISDNGSIVLGDGVFFASGKADILPEGYPTLEKLIDAFAAILSNSDNTRYIDSIVISGHTDWDGTNEMNRELSTRRANAVLDYILWNGAAKLSPYAQYFSAAGYGEERPIPGTDQNTAEGKAANRRIEISIVLKDDSILDLVDSYLNIDLPEGVSANATVG